MVKKQKDTTIFKNFSLRATYITLAAMICVAFFSVSFIIKQLNTQPAQAQKTVIELNDEIDDRKEEIQILEKEIAAYQEQINIKRKEVTNAQSQLSLIENQVAQTELEIEATEKKIQKTNDEIQKLNLEITATQQEIDQQKIKLSDYIRLIYEQDQISYLEVLLTNESFSEFYDYLQRTNEVHGDLKDTLDGLKETKADLETKKQIVEDRKKEEDSLKDELLNKKSELAEQSVAQGFLVSQVKLSQQQYQSYLYQLQVEQQQINADIAQLEKELRIELEKKANNSLDDLGPARLNWPVPNKGITAYFHDPDYPFKYVFEHPAIDVRASQGTQIRAAESGYVGKVKFRGDSSYAYIMLIHSDGLSTVYGHVSAVYVKEDQFVTQGEVIGRTGGAPGSVGAGNLSTGPHLHLEVRENGIPVNPLEYLP